MQKEKAVKDKQFHLSQLLLLGQCPDSHIYSINPRILEYKNNLTAEDLQQQVLYQLHFLRI